VEAFDEPDLEIVRNKSPMAVHDQFSLKICRSWLKTNQTMTDPLKPARLRMSNPRWSDVSRKPQCEKDTPGDALKDTINGLRK
jgi:hypothetical protein